MNCPRTASVLFLGVATFLAIPLTVSATDYYVSSTSGNDANSGTSSSAPWASLSKVNSRTYTAGDRILFARGGTWTGQLAPKGSGASGNPITITAYGSGNKPAFHGNGTVHNVVYLYNQQYWTIDNLDVSNNAGTSASNLGDYRGIGVQAQDVGQLSGFTIQNCYIHDVTGEVKWVGGSSSNSTGITFNTGWDASKKTGGIVFWVTTANNTKTWFNDVLVQDNQIVNCSMIGVTLKQWVGTVNWGKRASASDTNWTPHTNVTIKNNYFTQNGTAYGCDAIYPTNVRGGTIENNEVAGCGTCAIEMVFCDSLVVADNETYNVTRKAGGGDANGIDPDHGTTNITIEYNYSHDNQLNGILLFQVDGYGSSVVRYNILQNNKGNQLWCYSQSGSHSDVYNNVMYTNIANQQIVANGSTKPGTFSLKNNIFYSASSGANFATTNITYSHNNYHGTSMTVPPDSNAVVADPRMVNPGTGGSGGTGGTANNTLGGYKLQSTSPCIGKGTFISNNGGMDFWGNPLPSTAPDIGANQFTQSGGSGITYQAENAVAAGGVTFESNNAGFNGTGFANFPTSGGTLTFNNVDGNGGGPKSLAIRYANGGTTSRSGTITVNGTTSAITFNPTGAWTTWSTLNVNVTLNSGTTNTIQLASNGNDLGNIDEITVP